MKIISQLFWILLCSATGEVLSVLIAPIFPIPGSVLGMMLMFCALHFNILPLEKVYDVASWITANMALFFVPAGVAVMEQFGVLKDVWWQLILIIVVTTIGMRTFVGRFVQFLMKKFSKRKGEEV